METIKVTGYVLVGEMEGAIDLDGVPDVTQWRLKESIIYFNENDVKEKKTPYLRIEFNLVK